MIDAIRPNEAQLLVSIGWVCAEWRELTRKTNRAAQSWKRVCAHMMPKELMSTSIHRRDLGLTKRSHCYTANKYGYLDGTRCENKAHYYDDSMYPIFPSKSPALSQYVVWTLAKLSRDYKVRTRGRKQMDKRRRMHQDVCERLSKMPWLAEQTLRLVETEITSKKMLEDKRKFSGL